jgi:hypothetical protein
MSKEEINNLNKIEDIKLVKYPRFDFISDYYNMFTLIYIILMFVICSILIFFNLVGYIPISVLVIMFLEYLAFGLLGRKSRAYDKLDYDIYNCQIVLDNYKKIKDLGFDLQPESYYTERIKSYEKEQDKLYPNGITLWTRLELKYRIFKIQRKIDKL